MEENQSTPPGTRPNYKPNIYPIIYWALAYGVMAGVLLFVINILSRFITIIWFPVFLAGALWGAYRNYKKQKAQWMNSQGMTPQSQSPVNEFREAFGDIVTATSEMMAEQRTEDEAVAADQNAQEQGIEEVPSEPEDTTPAPPNQSQQPGPPFDSRQRGE